MARGAKTKATSDGNGQPAKVNAAKVALDKLTARINAFGRTVKTVREEGHQLLREVTFFALGLGDGNVKPMTELIKRSDGMNRKGMVQWLEKYAGVVRFSDKDEAGNKIEGFKTTPEFAKLREEFAADKKAFGAKLNKERFWEVNPDRPFEGLSLIALLNAAVNKVEKAAADKDKADKVKGAELVGKARAFIESITPKSDDDEGGEPEADDSAPITINNVGDEAAHAAHTLN